MVTDFKFFSPTKVVFGRNAEAQVGQLIKDLNCKKVLVHYGASSAEKSGLLKRVTDNLTKSGIEYITLGGVLPNPRLSKVYEGISLGKSEGVDFILAVGGGSVIDSSKAIGYGLYDDGDVWDYYNKTRSITGCYPIGSILTLAAAGSEMSDSSVITNEDDWLKRDAVSDFSRCKFAIMNPELTYTLPYYQTMCGVVDVLMHTMERYFLAEDTMMLTDEIAEGLMRTVRHYAFVLQKDPNNYDGRANLMWASSLSHNGLTGAGNSAGGDWASHQIEHEMGGMFDVAHGAGLSAIWDSWARYVYKKNPSRFARFGEKVFGVGLSGDADKDALLAIEAVKCFFKDIDMPTNLRELGITPTPAQIEEMAEKATYFGKRAIGDFMVLNKKEIIDIYNLAAK